MTEDGREPRTVELVGGPLDGERFEHSHTEIGHTIQIPNNAVAYRVTRHERDGLTEVAITELLMEAER